MTSAGPRHTGGHFLDAVGLFFDLEHCVENMVGQQRDTDLDGDQQDEQQRHPHDPFASRGRVAQPGQGSGEDLKSLAGVFEGTCR